MSLSLTKIASYYFIISEISDLLIFFSESCSSEYRTTKVIREGVHCKAFSLTPTVILVPLQATEEVEAIRCYADVEILGLDCVKVNCAPSKKKMFMY